MFKKLFRYWQNKTLFSKITDILFIGLIIAFIFPSGRMAIGGSVNRIKAMIVQPGPEKARISLPEPDLDWKLKDVNGLEMNMIEQKGKVKFINLWATWCPPCIGEMPEIEKLYNKFKDNEKISFFMISDEETEKLKEFTARKNYTFPVYQSLSPNPTGLRSNSIPATYILSKNNEIVIKEIGAANWGSKKTEEIINELLKE